MSALEGAAWRKSSHSIGMANCVEVAPASTVIAVRDTKDREGPVLLFDESAWKGFTEAIKRGSFS